MGAYSASCSSSGFGELDNGAGELEVDEQADASSSCSDGQFSMLLLLMLLSIIFEAIGMPIVDLLESTKSSGNAKK